MKALADEEFKLEEENKSYKIKALTSMEFMEVHADGSNSIREGKGLKSEDVKRLLSFGLVDTSEIEKMSSVALIKTAYAIYNKANLAEEERKNS